MSWVVDVIVNKTQTDVDFYNFPNDLGDATSFCAGTTDLLVTPSGTPAMSVVLEKGKIYLYVSSKNSYFSATLDTDTTLSVASNSSGSTRIDIVCVKFDTGVSSNPAGDNVVSTQYIQGTAGAGVPATPANHTKVAEITVPSGATTINDGSGGSGSIDDKRHALVLNMGEAQFIERSDTPTTNPPAGATKLYFKTDGKPYSLNSGGSESPLAGGALQSVQQSTAVVNGTNSTTTYSDALSVTFTPTAGANVLIAASLVWTVNVTGINVVARLLVDGSVVGTDPSMEYDITTVNKYVTASTQFWVTGLNVSSHTIKVQYKISSTAGSPSGVIQSGVLTAMVFNT